MKDFISSINVPLLLLLAYSIYFIYLVQIGTAISLPLALVFIFLVLLYSFNSYMLHIKKPEPHKVLEEKWANYDEEVEAKIEMFRQRVNNEFGKLEDKITKVNMVNTLVKKGKGGNNVW